MYTWGMKTTSDEVTVKLSLSSVAWAVGVICALIFLWKIQQIVVTLFFALIVMAALRPSVSWLEKKIRFPRIVAILTLYAVILLMIGLAFTVIVPPLIKELPNFVQTLSLPLPTDWTKMEFTISELSSFLPQLGSSFGTIFTIISSTFNGVFTFVTILVLASYLMLDRDRLHLKVSWFSKNPRHLALAKELIDQMEIQLGGWVRGQISLMVIIGIVTYVGLLLLSIPYALPLALAAGLLEVLPNLGPMVAAVPAIAVAFVFGGPWLALFVAIFYLLVQQFENNLIVPKVMKDNVDVNPLTTIVLILIGLKLANVVGALLAVPIYIVIRSAYAMWYRERLLKTRD
jgi:predicted PurR-regulated permease PerM